MLNCVYHPVQEMRVVDDEVRDKLLKTGEWFDTPTDAKEFRSMIEKEITNEKIRKK